MGKQKLNRRTFIKRSSMGALGVGLLSDNAFSHKISPKNYNPPRIKDYRRLGRTGAMVSDIGSAIPYSEPVLKAVIDSGVNFIETAESYNNGKNEQLIGNVIKNYDREKLFITTKVNTSLGFIKSSDDIIRRAEESLRRMNTPYIDLYMMHQAQSLLKVGDKNFHRACDKLIKEGKIMFRGLSCHGTLWWQEPGGSLEDILMSAIEDERFDVLFFPYNFLEPEMGERVLKACKTKNIGTMIMKSNPVVVYEDYERILNRGDDLGFLEKKDYEKKRVQMEKAGIFFKKYNMTDIEKLKEGAYQFILSNKDVSTICCRFRNFSDIDRYIQLSGTTLDSRTGELLADFRENLGFLNCRIGCNMCEKSCPHNIPVNTIMRYYYYSRSLNEDEIAIRYYGELQGRKPDICHDCTGACEKACPYNVAIKDLLADAHKKLNRAVTFNHASTS
jgi:predicted aldo/keto reductase-like oxidoreductase